CYYRAALKSGLMPGKRTFKLLLPPALLLFYTVTFLIMTKFDEPYPAVIQPGFKATASNLDTLRSRTAKIIVTDTDGKEYHPEFIDLMPFLPSNRGTNVFGVLPNSDYAQVERAIPRTSSIINQHVFIDYRSHRALKVKETFPSFLEFLKYGVDARFDAKGAEITFVLSEKTLDIPSGESVVKELERKTYSLGE
ncbi:MAG: hypothetical protein WA913_06130, partial [Pricia sp.]